MLFTEEAEDEEEEEDEDGDVEGDLELHAGMDATGIETPLVDGISSVASGLSTPGGIVDMRKGIRYATRNFVMSPIQPCETNADMLPVTVATRLRTSRSSSTRSWSRRRRRLGPRSTDLATSTSSLVRPAPLSAAPTGPARKQVACAVALKTQATRRLHQRTTTTRPRRRRRKLRPRRARSTRISSFKEIHRGSLVNDRLTQPAHAPSHTHTKTSMYTSSTCSSMCSLTREMG